MTDLPERKSIEDCASRFEPVAGSPVALHDALSRLVAAVDLYLDRPGCNIPSQQTAQRRLRWALERAQEALQS